MKHLIAGILSVVIGLSATNTYTINGVKNPVTDYTAIEEHFTPLCENNYGSISIYNPDDLNADILENRTESEDVVVERVVGMVTNFDRKGDGIVLNTSDTTYNYISYNSVNFETHDGTIILSYLVYNPDTNYTDDVIERYDFVLDREYED